MATVTRLVTTPDSGNTPNTSGAFTPQQNDLLVAVIVGSVSQVDTDDVPTASANGITFTNVASGAAVRTVYNGSANSMAISVAAQLVGASPVSMTVSWAPTDQATSTVIDVYAIRSSGGRAGVDAVRQVDNTDNGTASGTPSITFAQAVLTGNVTLVAVANLSGPANVEQPTGWTEVNDTSCTAPVAGLEVAARTSGFTGTTVTWAGTSATNWGAAGIEIDTSTPVVNATLTTLTGNATAAGGDGAITSVRNATFAATTTGGATAAGEQGALRSNATFSATTTGDAAAAGADGALKGGATLSATTTGDAAAAGGTGAITSTTPSTEYVDGVAVTVHYTVTTQNRHAVLNTDPGDAVAAGGTGAILAGFDATFTTDTAGATAAGQAGALTGGASISTQTGDAAAAGEAGTLTGGARISTLTGDAVAAGGDGALKGGATLSTLTGDATAAGGQGALTATSGATLTTLTGDATAAGGTGALLGALSATFSTVTGDAVAAGGTGSFKVSATFATTVGDATAAGGTGAFTATASVTFTTATGDATASGEIGALTAFSATTFQTLTGTAAAAGVEGALTGGATFLTTVAAAATAAGLDGEWTGGATFTTATGTATAAGGVGGLVIVVGLHTVDVTIGPRRVHVEVLPMLPVVEVGVRVVRVEATAERVHQIETGVRERRVSAERIET